MTVDETSLCTNLLSTRKDFVASKTGKKLSTFSKKRMARLWHTMLLVLMEQRSIPLTCEIIPRDGGEEKSLMVLLVEALAEAADLPYRPHPYGELVVRGKSATRSSIDPNPKAPS